MDLTESFIDLTILNDFGMGQKDWGGRGRGIDKCFQCLNTENCKPSKKRWSVWQESLTKIWVIVFNLECLYCILRTPQEKFSIFK